MTVPVNNKRQELPTGSWPTRTAITWGDSPPGATDLPPIEVPPLDLPPVDVPPVETGFPEEKH
ncbi:hypothetical protein HYFRA_00004640 [Hymenoscyphus fraxineus]|uniref:Uncharacterized protein n=1 Tax=Hymenoscyphus fraxineus TaxID=746836 RepID=A0A9N9L0B8_9HELO|nr:hypothetical protein HYFRA_00004640 [Hymenoscyphus fraxineus]